eukprot:scaffold98649_cov24-Phaeocystis_antarctica.AAC.1
MDRWLGTTALRCWDPMLGPNAGSLTTQRLHLSIVACGAASPAPAEDLSKARLKPSAMVLGSSPVWHTPGGARRALRPASRTRCAPEDGGGVGG